MIKQNSQLLPLALLLVQVVSTNIQAEDWPRFRGTNGAGVSEATTVPVSWTDEDYNWNVELPGVGHGSPVVWGEKLFVNCATDEGKTRLVQCRSTETGELLWAKEFESTSHKAHKFNSFATSTPCVDAERVYISWGTPEELVIIALAHSGDVVWEARNLGQVKGGHGFGTSPIIHGDLLVIANDTAKKSSLIALNRETGEMAWEFPRPGGRLNFSTPCVYSSGSNPDLLIFVAWPIGITAINAQTGKMAWEIESFDVNKGQRAVASPIVYDDLVMANCAFVSNPKHLVVLKPQAKTAEEVFRVDNSSVPHIPSLLAYEGLLYAWADKGICTCYEIASGYKVWQKRIGGNYFSSPICVNGKIYCVDANGICVVIQSGRTYEELARIDLGEATRATPAVANGQMYLRTFSHLMAIGGSDITDKN